MDSFEAAKVVHDRIFRLETEPVARKIVGYIYLQDLPEQEMIRLALGPDSLIQNLIQNSKTALRLASAPVISPTINPNTLLDPSNPLPSFSPVSLRPFSAPPAFRKVTPYWNSQLGGEQLPVPNSAFKLIPLSDYVPEEYGLQSQFSLDDSLESMNLVTSGFPNDYYCQEAAFDNLSIRGSENSPNLLDFPVKTCHYFNKGFCKHGSNCRYFHREAFHDSYPPMFGSYAYEVPSEDQVFSPGSLEKLELEITELLKSRRGPVSIASLPMMYYEKYGRTLQAEGYLTESQRHGKAGYSLTKLLERLKSSIQLIGRPHGQHAVILLEDVPKYIADIRGERNDPGPIVNGSHQIYLTFPAESTFTEEDVSTYFSNFGPVQDVRIPSQQKRMFGFVTFVSADTVRLILSKGNPHYVCGARVLVKPYREKSKIIERKYVEKFEPPFCYHSFPIDGDSELQAGWESRLFRRHAMEEHEQVLDLETMRLSQLQLARKPLTPQPCLGYSMDEIKVSKDHPRFHSTERVNYLLDVLNNGSTSDKYPINNCSDQESTQGPNLPDSPFASTVASSISAVI